MMANIGVDIGHGSNTFPPNKGVYKNGKGYAEHTFNSKVAVLLEQFLKSAGHRVYMAQKPYSPDVKLAKRTDYYNSLDLDLIISIHANAASNPEAKGLCAFYWHISEKGKKAAQIYAKYVKEYGYTLYNNGFYASRPNHWSNFHMVRETKAPAILTENGFMTNPEEFELIFKSDKYVQDVAEILAKTAIEYLGSGKINTKPITKPSTPTKTEKQSKPVSNNKANLIVDGKWGSETTKALQKALGTVVDGVISSQPRNHVTEAIYNGITFGDKGSMVIRALQKKIGAKVDGKLGPETVRKLQRYLGTPVDGKISRPTSIMVKELQRRLNEGTF
jgi:N-acetylmuramoyl-L-alanine amidase